MIETRVYVIIVNYNGYVDTIECLESILRNNYTSYRVLVIDNGSSDKSMDHIKAWAEGKLDISVGPDNPLQHLLYPPIRKPIPYVYYTKEEAEKGGDRKKEKDLEEAAKDNDTMTMQYPLIFIQAGNNRFFAGGDNIGIRYASAKNDFHYVWLLNNDTVIDQDALKHLVAKANKNRNRKVGITGSKLLYYHNPRIIQAVGGNYNKWLGNSNHIGALTEDEGQYDMDDVKMDYVVGASMFVNKEFLNDVGILCEDYSIYFEELDWAERGRRKGWELGYSFQSRVYHKEGGFHRPHVERQRKELFNRVLLLEE